MQKVLIIDNDESRIRQITCKIAELNSDASIVSVSDFENAVASVNLEKPDILALNYNKNDSKGRELIGKLIRRDLKILLFQEGELYEIIGKPS